MADDIFEGLPPPTIHAIASESEQLSPSDNQGLPPVTMTPVLLPCHQERPQAREASRTS
ncbi:hypothetical protein HPP92_006904 [Vanilla planifolia]|uniref:Uncharacterized protein n=1 Tax=Vanilla planifolia TaxID=51239 RepID=A0A835RD11_VANPL|nr:hypothetical protein HPP92_006904 [Vanilla planifolia]